MRPLADNPVARHAVRLGGRGHRPWAILAVLVGAAALGAFLQKYWLGLEEYNLLRPAIAVRWLGFALIAEAVVALPWAALRASGVWRRLRLDGHLDDYRRSRLAPGTIVGGAFWGAARPLLVLLAVSCAIAVGVALWAGEPRLPEVLAAHGVLATQVLAYLALGLYLGDRFRSAAGAVPIALGVLAASLGAVWCLEPMYGRIPSPERWIFWTLLPNPLTAVGTALNTDVLRFGWLYARVHAHEYFFQYPNVWQTGAFYLTCATLSVAALVNRVRRSEPAGR